MNHKYHKKAIRILEINQFLRLMYLFQQSKTGNDPSENKQGDCSPY
jgi:hypothetical protein